MTDRADGRWVKVEFYGRLPDHEVITEVDVAEVGATLMRAFGFTHIDDLTVVALAPGEPACTHGGDCPLPGHPRNLHNYAGEPPLPDPAALEPDAVFRPWVSSTDWAEAIRPGAFGNLPATVPVTEVPGGRQIGTAIVREVDGGIVAEWTADRPGLFRIGETIEADLPMAPLSFAFRPAEDPLEELPHKLTCPSCGGPIDHAVKAEDQGMVSCEHQLSPHHPVA